MRDGRTGKDVRDGRDVRDVRGKSEAVKIRCVRSGRRCLRALCVKLFADFALRLDAFKTSASRARAAKQAEAVADALCRPSELISHGASRSGRLRAPTALLRNLPSERSAFCGAFPRPTKQTFRPMASEARFEGASPPMSKSHRPCQTALRQDVRPRTQELYQNHLASGKSDGGERRAGVEGKVQAC